MKTERSRCATKACMRKNSMTKKPRYGNFEGCPHKLDKLPKGGGRVSGVCGRGSAGARMSAVAALLFVGMMRQGVFANDNYLGGSWPNSATITLNTANTGGGANITTAENGFPVLIRLLSAQSAIFTQALPNGQDIRFASSTGTHLPYQIEYWNKAADSAIIWVKVDIQANNNTQYIMMYWGNASAGDSSSTGPTPVGNPFSNGFLAVYHLNETANTTPNGYADATGVYTATGYNMVSGDQVPAQVGNGQNFGNGLLGKRLSIFGSPSGTGCTINVSAVNASGSIATVSAAPVTGGSGYVVGDRLLVSGGDGGIVSVASVSGGVVTGVSLDGNNNSTPGSNCTLNITAPGGVVTGASIAAAGTGYFVGDILTITGGNGDATVQVTAGNTTNGGNNGEGVGAISIISGGTGYATGTPIATTNNNFYTTGTKATTNLGAGINFGGAPNITCSAWAWSNGNSNQDNIISMSSGTNGSYIDFNRKDASNLNLSGGANASGTKDDWTTDNGFPDPSTSWMHVGVTKTSAGAAVFYVNGIARTTTTNNIPLGTPTYDFNEIGAKFYANWGQWFQGKLNEVQISNVVRDAGWMSLCYQSQQTSPTWMTISIATTPFVTTQPTNQSTTVGSTATFSVAAGGSPPLSYQWYKGTPGSGTPVGTNSNSYTTPPTVAGDNGTTFYCVVSNSYSPPTAQSNTATLAVCTTAPSISVPPSNQTVNAPATANFTVSASCAAAYQWLRYNGSSWVNVSTTDGSTGQTAASYTTGPTSSGDNGAQFRCLVSNALGPDTSTAATLTVNCPSPITQQPVSPPTDTAGQNATFSVGTSGSGLTYQWQRLNAGGTTWANVTTGIGANTATYSFTTATADNGAQFRCQVTAGPCVTNSNAALLIVCTPPGTLQQQPVSWAGIAGSTASFSIVIAAGVTSPAYQWQRSNDTGKTWAAVPTGNGSGATPTYTFVAQATDNAAEFRCVITGACGTTTSIVATASVCSPPSITTQPAPQNVTDGATATFTVVRAEAEPTLTNGNPALTPARAGAMWQRAAMRQHLPLLPA